jgi:hypothetical protein
VERALRNPHRSACEIPAKQEAAQLLFHGLNGGVREEPLTWYHLTNRTFYLKK